MRDEHDVFRQIVEKRGGLVEEQRQVVFDTGRGDAAGNILVDDRLRRVALEGFAEAGTGFRAGLLVHREFACRQQVDGLHWENSALGVRVEGADGVDLVIEQIDAVGQLRAHRKEVDQPAAH